MTLDLDIIRARADAATPGPWEANGDDIVVAPDGAKRVVAVGLCFQHTVPAGAATRNAAFVAAAREDVPVLCGEVERLTIERDEARALVRGLEADEEALDARIYRAIGEAITRWDAEKVGAP